MHQPNQLNGVIRMNVTHNNTTPQSALQSASDGIPLPVYSEPPPYSPKPVKQGAPTGRRSMWQGKKLPQYPEDGKYYRRPSAVQLANAFAEPNPKHWVNIWLRRLAILNPSRYSALRSAFADKGRAGLRACRYQSQQPCRQCGASERFAVQNQCSRCNTAVRYGVAPKASEQELIKREQKRQQKASAEEAESRTGGIEMAGYPSGWMFRLEGARVMVVHPVKTRSLPVLLDENRIGQNMQDAEFRALYQWACHNRALPEGAMYQAG